MCISCSCEFGFHVLIICIDIMIIQKNMKNHLKMCIMRFTAFGRASPQLGTSNPQLYCDPSKSEKTVAKVCISRSLHLRMSMDS